MEKPLFRSGDIV